MLQIINIDKEYKELKKMRPCMELPEILEFCANAINEKGLGSELDNIVFSVKGKEYYPESYSIENKVKITGEIYFVGKVKNIVEPFFKYY